MNSPAECEESLFEAAIRLRGFERAAFLDLKCGGDTSMRRRLDTLIAAHESPGAFMLDDIPSSNRVRVAPLDNGEESIGQTIGRYKLLEKLGEGGCGVVYVAEQSVPIRRRLALKVIK